MTESSTEPAVDPERTKSPRRGMCAAVLGLEGIVLGLTAPVMIKVSDVSAATALPIALGLAVVCFLLSGLLPSVASLPGGFAKRRPWAYVAGWVVQVAALALGFVIPLMFALGVIFAILWGMADGLGRKIDRERAAAFAAYDRTHPAD